MSIKSLEELVSSVDSVVGHLRNVQTGAHIFPVVAPEFSNFRDEQVAAENAAILTDQSHHMVEALVEGPDALKLISFLSGNSMKGFEPNQAKQFVPCSHDGYIIGDGIVFYLAPNLLNIVGRAPLQNWAKYHAEASGLEVSVSIDPRSPANPNGKAVRRRHYRFQVQGPRALDIMMKVNGGPLPDVKFFRMCEVNIAGRRVRALRHGMAGTAGLEVWGPYDDIDAIRDAIVEAGEAFGLKQVGARAYPTGALISGWIPSILPAVYSGDKLKAYREWLPATGYEANCSIGGSFVSENIEDYYLSPFDLNYGSFIKFDHEFIGREALEGKSKTLGRKKVSFVWNAEDFGRIYQSLAEPGKLPYKYLELPMSTYAVSPFDQLSKNGKMVGVSMFTGYAHTERAILSLGVVDPDIKIGEELVLLWGEENGGTRKPTVERHRQLEVRVRVAPAPFSKEVRDHYVEGGWRKVAV